MSLTVQISEEQFVGMHIIMFRAFHEVMSHCKGSCQQTIAKYFDAAYELIQARRDGKAVESDFNRLKRFLEQDLSGFEDVWIKIFIETPQLGMDGRNQEKMDLLHELGKSENHLNMDRHLREFVSAYGAEHAHRAH